VQIALHETAEIGARAGRILLGDRRLDRMGLVGRRPDDTADRRVRRADDLGAYGVMVTDAVEEVGDDVTAALEAGISCVTWSDEPALADRHGAAFAAMGRTLLTGANLASGIAPCLAAHEAARSDEVLDVLVAWTEPGRRQRRGEAIAFPDPVGSLWGTQVGSKGISRSVAAPVEGIWSGATVRVTASTGDGVVVRVVGVADLAVHLEALALTAGAMSIDSFGYGAARPEDRPDDYLLAALDAGLDVATHTLDL